VSVIRGWFHGDVREHTQVHGYSRSVSGIDRCGRNWFNAQTLEEESGSEYKSVLPRAIEKYRQHTASPSFYTTCLKIPLHLRT
jgi:hypothetical protein